MLVRDKARFLQRTRERHSPAETLPDVQELIAIISHAQLKPGEMLQIQILPETAKKLKMKFPIRMITDYLRRYIRSIGVESDYRIRKGSVGGVGIIDVTYLPASIEHTAGKRPKKQTA